MSIRFKAGEFIKCQGSPIKIVKWLAEGGQGDVYIIEQDGQKKALKWYKPNGMGKDPDAFYENLKQNYFKGAPDKKVFLWPEDITEWKDGTFGYVMPLRPDGFYEVGDYLLTKVRFSSLKTVIDAALNIVSAYRILHNNGYCYQDLNDGNFFINPRNGAVLICDNDNVAPDGTHTGIVGKPGYIAPEIILGANEKDRSKRKMPDTYSDRFSMSIIIFMLFCLTRPLEGKRVLAPRTEKLMEKVYGSDVHFIMDDIKHPEYGPDPDVQKNVFRIWGALPTYVRDLFSKAFSQKAISSPGARPTELKWLETLVRFRSEILRCQCGVEVLTENGKPIVCSRCNNKINVPFRLSFTGSNYSIPGVPDSRIYRCQLGPCNANEALNPVGRVLANKANPNQLGIRNLTEKYWDAETPSGRGKKVMPKDVVPLKNGIKLVIESEKIIIEEN
ncbi:MAG: hypothetical protein J6F33_05555 [Acidaminococcaceae bacterium]|nr:hypothetical protein [Acidaminococcaceae bacterium]